MADDPLDDPREYDEPISLAICPECGGPLEWDTTMVGEDPERLGYKWWCDGCEGYVKEAAPTQY
jgi:hypothetical protein